MPVQQILQRHGEGLSFLRDCTADCAGGEGFAEAWRRAVGSRAGAEGFSARDGELLLLFGDGFGASDTDGQISHLELYSGLFGEALDRAREDRDRKSKLYLTLGIFAGLSAALLLC